MTESMRDRAEDVARKSLSCHSIRISGEWDVPSQARDLVFNLDRAGLLASPALVECGEAAIEYSQCGVYINDPRHERMRAAGRALLAERKPKPRWTVRVTSVSTNPCALYRDGVNLTGAVFTEAEARAVAAALEALEGK